MNGLDIYLPQEYMETPKVIGFWDDQPNPFQKRSHKRLNCEKEWIESGLPIQIFRLPGIYGPGRSTFEAIRNKKIRVISKKIRYFQEYMLLILQMQLFIYYKIKIT